uniref:Uncharacterized protein n=1 Tax=Nomascus leucogenys TaxID=61853 RepID=A0A2I3HD16_NOMLE
VLSLFLFCTSKTKKNVLL